MCETCVCALKPFCTHTHHSDLFLHELLGKGRWRQTVTRSFRFQKLHIILCKYLLHTAPINHNRGHFIKLCNRSRLLKFLTDIKPNLSFFSWELWWQQWTSKQTKQLAGYCIMMTADDIKRINDSECSFSINQNLRSPMLVNHWQRWGQTPWITGHNSPEKCLPPCN